MRSSSFWIERLGLQSHPEGGYYQEVYRSPHLSNHPSNSKTRSLSTSIYFLLEGKNISHFHELDSDELWYFHDGKGAYIHLFDKGIYRKEELSLDTAGHPQILIPAGSQFAAEVIDQQGYVLMGCVVSPGFDFEDFRMINKAEMIRQYPAHEKLIHRFCLE